MVFDASSVSCPLIRLRLAYSLGKLGDACDACDACSARLGLGYTASPACDAPSLQLTLMRVMRVGLASLACDAPTLELLPSLELMPRSELLPRLRVMRLPYSLELPLMRLRLGFA